MNEILDNVEVLKDLIANSSEYKEYDKLTKELDKDKQINEIIEKIKRLQKEVVNKEIKNEETNELELELEGLFNKLNSNKRYKDYLESSKRLNELITKIQDRFSQSFNEIIN